MKEELRPQIKKVEVEDRTVNHMSRQKMLTDPKVKAFGFISPEILPDEKYCLQLPKLTSMEETLVTEVLDDLNIAAPKEKHLEELEVKEVSYIPLYQFCDKTILVDISLQSPQLRTEETEAKPVLVTNSPSDLFAQVRKLRQITLVKYRK